MRVHLKTPYRDAENAQWLRVFRLFDVDRDRSVTWEEFWKYSRLREQPVKPEIIDNMSQFDFLRVAAYHFKQNDGSKDKRLNLREFMNFYKRVQPKSEFKRASTKLWQSLFNQFDSDKDNRVEWAEFEVIGKQRVMFTNLEKEAKKQEGRRKRPEPVKKAK